MTGSALPALLLTDPENEKAEFAPVLGNPSSPPSPVKSAESVTSSELNDVNSREMPLGRLGTTTIVNEDVAISNGMSSALDMLSLHRSELCLL